MKGIKEIKDEDLIEAFLLGDKNRGDKLVHGVLRKNEIFRVGPS
jgi:hypothetical protein